MTLVFSAQTACSGIYAQTKNPAAGGAVVAMIFIYYCSYTMVSSPLHSHTPQHSQHLPSALLGR